MLIDNVDESSACAPSSTTTSASANIANNESNSATGAGASVPLKLSLSVRRPAATATTDDATLLQDEENDLNNADNAETNPQEGATISIFFLFCTHHSAVE